MENTGWAFRLMLKKYEYECYNRGFQAQNYSSGAKGPGSIRGYIGLRFSENLKFLNSCILHSHNKGNMS